MRLPVLALTLSATLATPLSAQEARSWIYDAEFPAVRSEARLNLVATELGSPRASAASDLPRGSIWGTCGAAGEISLRFDAFVSTADFGDTVPFALTGSVGASFSMDGIYTQQGDDPVGGIEITVAAGGHEMEVLAASETVRFGLAGTPDLHFMLEQIANLGYVAQFDADCAALADADVIQGAGATDPIAQVSVDLVPDVGPEISGHVWSRYTHISDDVFQTVLSVTYSVPETDDALLNAFCAIGAQGPYVVLRVAADIEGLSDHDFAVMQVTSGDGRTIDIEGTVAGQRSEIGISGMSLELEMSDPAWLVIAGDPTVRFQRAGGQSLTITGNGPSTLGPFLADCDQIGDLTPESGITPSAPIGAQDGYLACDSFGRVGSQDTGQPLVLSFVNETSAYRGLLWIDASGTPVDQAGLNPGESTSFTTDPGHVWMATDGPGNCQELIQPVVGQSEYRLLVQ